MLGCVKNRFSGVAVLWLCLGLTTGFLQGETYKRDIVIYGGTSAAISAVQVKKNGEVRGGRLDTHLGGLSSSGLGWTDSGRKEAIVELPVTSTTVFGATTKAWNPGSGRTWKSTEIEAKAPLRSMVIAVRCGFSNLMSRSKFSNLGSRKTSSRCSGTSGWTGKMELRWKRNGSSPSPPCPEIDSKGKMFLDCTYEGDLMASAGVSYFVEGNRIQSGGETLSGVQTRNARSHQFKGKVDPFVVAGDESSGLLARISQDPPGEEGSGDAKMQAYNFRFVSYASTGQSIAFPEAEWL